MMTFILLIKAWLIFNGLLFLWFFRAFTPAELEASRKAARRTGGSFT